MADTFRIYKKADNTKVADGPSPLTITGLAAGTEVATGDYQATRVQGDQESEKVDIPAFTVLATRSFDPNGDIKPTEANTLDEIKAWLTAHGIDFTGKTLKADLLALVPQD